MSRYQFASIDTTFLLSCHHLESIDIKRLEHILIQTRMGPLSFAQACPQFIRPPALNGKDLLNPAVILREILLQQNTELEPLYTLEIQN
jgi:hypothetical protein